MSKQSSNKVPNKKQKKDGFVMSTSKYDDPPSSSSAHDFLGVDKVFPPTTEVLAPYTAIPPTNNAIFVCSLCNSLGPDQRVFVRVYDDRLTCSNEIILTQSPTNPKVYTGLVPVVPNKVLRLRVAVKFPGNDNPFKENSMNGWGSWGTGPVHREYQIGSSTTDVICTAVVRDKFSKYNYNTRNEVCSAAEATNGWVLLMGWLAAHFADEPTLALFNQKLSEVKYFEADRVRVTYCRIRLLDILLAVTDHFPDMEGIDTVWLLRWMLLARKTSTYVVVTYTINYETCDVASLVNIMDVYKALKAESSSDFRGIAIEFVSRLAQGVPPFRMPWAMLWLALTSSSIPEGIVRKYPMEAVEYLPLFADESIRPEFVTEILGCFSNLRVFRSEVMWYDKLPDEVIAKITSASTYRQSMPQYEPEVALEEYRTLMYFTLESDGFLSVGFSFTTQQYLKVSSDALNSLGVYDRANIAAMEVVRKLATLTDSPNFNVRCHSLIVSRFQELREYLGPRSLQGDDTLVPSVYNILRDLMPFKKLPGVGRAIREMQSVLPSINCQGLLDRFVLFVREDDEDLCIIEAADFKVLCHKAENDPFAMRKYFLDVLGKVLKPSNLSKDYLQPHRNFLHQLF
jgi:hypothetical protein